MTNDIFRKRPILGNRILTPISERPNYKQVMSLWEAERRCKYYPQMKQSMFTPPTGCRVVQRNVNGTTKYWEMLCGCDLTETPAPQKVIAKMKEFAFNWSERGDNKPKPNFTTEYKRLMKSITDK